MIELHEPLKIWNELLLKKKRNCIPVYWDIIRCLDPARTTELRMEEANHHVLQFVYGQEFMETGTWRLSPHFESKPFSVQPASDANSNSNV